MNRVMPHILDKKILATIDGEESISEVFHRVENIIKLWSDKLR